MSRKFIVQNSVTGILFESHVAAKTKYKRKCLSARHSYLFNFGGLICQSDRLDLLYLLL